MRLFISSNPVVLSHGYLSSPQTSFDICLIGFSSFIISAPSVLPRPPIANLIH